MNTFENCRYEDADQTTIRATRNGVVVFIAVNAEKVDYVELIESGVAIADYEAPALDLKAYAAAKRWQIEIGGTTWNGWPVATDREGSQPKALAAFVALGAGLRTDGEEWKFADGIFRPLTNVEMASLATAILTHISMAFAIEAAVIANIDAEIITTAEQIDAADWPGLA